MRLLDAGAELAGDTVQSMGSASEGSQPARSFRDLRVWQEALQLSLDVERLVRPLSHGFYRPLADQLCRAASSVPSNIAEGWGRATPPDRQRFYGVAWSSLQEVEGRLLELEALRRVAVSDVRACALRACHVGRLLHAFRRGKDR